MRIGIGYDIHALKKGRPLILGGVRIPFPKGLVGHSDGDALWHAVLDAVLGALGEGDIGEHFPDTERKYKNAPGSFFAEKVRHFLRRRRLRVGHVDAVVIAEAPKLSLYKERMKKNIAKGLGIPVRNVNVKAKTNEGLDGVGRVKAIACHAVASVRR